jgi:putative ABC transport system substrate-binding protein
VRRQTLLRVLGYATVVCSLAAHAQQSAATPHRIGILTAGPLAERAHLIAAFQEGLREFGYVGSRSLVFDIRSAEGQPQRLSILASELANLKVAVMFADTTVAVQAAKRATQQIPIVMGSPGDPVGTGLVASLARPGGNVTGMTTMAFELSRKRLELLVELLPTGSRIAVLWNSSNAASEENWHENEAAARTLELVVQSYPVPFTAQLVDKLEAIGRANMDAMVVLPDPMLLGDKRRLAEFAIKERLPTMFEQREHVEAGGLMCYGPNLTELYRHAASFVDRILKGAKPADLPVEQATRFDLVINLKTAKALGLTIPPSLLARADELIE